MNSSFLKTIFSLITYNDSKKMDFHIPEIKEDESENKKEFENKEVNSEKRKPEKSKKHSSGFSKPKTLEEIKKYKEASSSKKQPEKESVSDDEPVSVTENKDRVSKKIDENIKYVKKKFNSPDNMDLIVRELTIYKNQRAVLFSIDGMINNIVVNESIIKPMLNKDNYEDVDDSCLLDHIFTRVIQVNQIKKVGTQGEAIIDVLLGNTVVYIDGCEQCISCETKGFEKRGVDKPSTEGVVKGPQEGFNESVRTNVTLIRRILRNEALTTEFMYIGKRTNSLCAVVYLENIANKALVEEVKRRVKNIDTDYIQGNGFLEEFIDDNPMSILPTILSTERPDRSASHLTEGKVGVLVDGTPFCMIVPVTLADMLHTSEDSTLKWQFGTILRFIRLFAVGTAVLLPGFYVALTTFHRDMIPTDLLIAIAKARENVPFPTIIELLLMEFSFELIREAGIRIPGIIGNTIGIIGALILGQAAVQANLVSPVLIIIVAFSGLGNFAIPDFSLAFSVIIMRYVYIFLGAVLGFYGIALGILISFSYLVNLKSFGVPMLSTIAPKTRRSNDFILRLPLWKQEFRPDYVNPQDIRRQPRISRKWVKHKNVNMNDDSKKGSDE